MEKKKNIGFGSALGFIMAAAGSAVGLGNLWAFPYKTAKNGGAAFVLLYILCVIFIGFVTMLTEIHLGRRAAANAVTAYKKADHRAGWMGLVAVAIPLFIVCYYCVLGGWTLKFAVNSFSGNAGILPAFSTDTGSVILYTGLFVFAALAIIAAGVEKGIEAISKVLMPLLFIILLVIVAYSLSLGEGVAEGLRFYLYPDFSKLTAESVLAAMSQAFYSLSLGMGIMISYGSYMGRGVDVVRSTAVICIFDTIVALLAGLAIFPAVAHFDPELLNGSKGVALIYIILPEVFESMGFAGKLISFAFFTMVVIAALTSIMSLYEVCTQFFLQKFRIARKAAAIGVGIFCLAVSIPVGISVGHVAICGETAPTLFGMDWLTFFDEVTNTVLMPVSAFLSCLVIGWCVTPKKAIEEMKELGAKFPPFIEKAYPVCIRIIAPLLILIIEVGGVIGEFRGGNGAVVLCAYGLIALCAVVYFLFLCHGETGTNADELTPKNR